MARPSKTPVTTTSTTSVTSITNTLAPTPTETFSAACAAQRSEYPRFAQQAARSISTTVAFEVLVINMRAARCPIPSAATATSTTTSSSAAFTPTPTPTLVDCTQLDDIYQAALGLDGDVTDALEALVAAGCPVPDSQIYTPTSLMSEVRGAKAW